VVPLRGVFWVLFGLLCAAGLVDLALLIKHAYLLLSKDTQHPASVSVLLVSGLLAVPLGLFCWVVRKHLVDLPAIAAPVVSSEQVLFQAGIPREDLETLGSERFPNHIDPGQRTDNWVRGGILLVGLLTVATVIVLYSQERPSASAASGSVPAARTVVTASPGQSLGVLLVVPCGTLLLILLCDNRDYTSSRSGRRCWSSVSSLPWAWADWPWRRRDRDWGLGWASWAAPGRCVPAPTFGAPGAIRG
jgi:hypothetical protein